MPPKSKKASSLAVAAAPTADPMTLLFRREVSSLLNATPTARDGHPIEVLAAIERLSASGMQQSVQLCRAGEETWVTRTEGARSYFPRVGRIQKRVREADDIEEEEEDETPRKAAKVLPTPKTKGKKAPGAPRKHRHASSPTPDGEVTESESHAKLRRNVLEALGRGLRRSARKNEDVLIKAEEGDDDLTSLCGRVGGLDVQSAIDAESEYEPSLVGGVASTSRLPTTRSGRA